MGRLGQVDRWAGGWVNAWLAKCSISGLSVVCWMVELSRALGSGWTRAALLVYFMVG